MQRVVIGTRGSALALWQARHVAELLRARHSGIEIEEKILKTEGDEDQSSTIVSLGAVGVFVRRLEQALLAGEVDVAVHSLKDLPSDQPTGLLVAAVPERHDPRDAIVTRDGKSLEELAAGTVVGTGSLRRRAQLLHARPDLRVESIRGNVDTRVGRVKQGSMDAIVLALAGLERLGIDDVGVRPIHPKVCLPAVGQGALAIEARVDDRATREIVESLTHEPSLAAVTAERAFFRRLGGGCQAPASAHASVDGARLHVDALVADPGRRGDDRRSGDGRGFGGARDRNPPGRAPSRRRCEADAGRGASRRAARRWVSGAGFSPGAGSC